MALLQYCHVFFIVVKCFGVIGNSLGVQAFVSYSITLLISIVSSTQQIVESVHKCCLGQKVRNHVNSMSLYRKSSADEYTQHIDSLYDNHKQMIVSVWQYSHGCPKMEIGLMKLYNPQIRRE